MDKELKKLLNNYVNVIYGKAFPINPTTDQLHLLLDYISNLEQQCKKQKEVIYKLKEWINIVQQNKDNKHLEPFISTDELDELLDILKEVE